MTLRLSIFLAFLAYSATSNIYSKSLRLSKLASDSAFLQQDEEECAPGCPSYYISDGWLDPECYVEECNYDGKDKNLPFCAPHCPDEWVGDGICDEDCLVEECEGDNGDCDECSAGCSISWVGDGVCNQECLTEECQYDLEDCQYLDFNSDSDLDLDE